MGLSSFIKQHQVLGLFLESRQSTNVNRAEGPLFNPLVFGVSGNGGWDKLDAEILLLGICAKEMRSK